MLPMPLDNNPRCCQLCSQQNAGYSQKNQILNIVLGYLPSLMCIVEDWQRLHVVVGARISSLFVFSHANKEISGKLKAQEAAGHAWGDLK